jgi:hypothetical protein
MTMRLPDAYHTMMLNFCFARRRAFPTYYNWKRARAHRRRMIEKFGYVPGVGDRVEDCRGVIGTITEVDARGPDTVVIDDEHACSLWNCCDPVEPPR